MLLCGLIYILFVTMFIKIHGLWIQKGKGKMGVVSVAQTSGKGILHICSLIFLIYHFCFVCFFSCNISVWKCVAIRVDGFKYGYYRGQKSKVQTWYWYLVRDIVVYCTEVNKVSFFLKWLNRHSGSQFMFLIGKHKGCCSSGVRIM